MPHLPAPGRPLPVSTFRVQLRPASEDHPGFVFEDAAAVVPYLAELGVTHLYCSPYLASAAGSTHGYDVVDHSRLDDELGGQAGFDRLAQACRESGLGIVLDIVPNHVSVAEPESQNPVWWDVLQHGQQSQYAAWFDIDWASTGRVLVPVLGGSIGEAVERGEITVDDDGQLGTVVRYYDHVLPVAPGTENLRGDVLALLDAQHYRLSHWKTAGEELNYRRFFDVTTLAGVRVEDPDVFAQTHRLVLDQLSSGVLDGLRIDHPDGLADPEGYLVQLADASGDAWVVVEKILEAGVSEVLPDSWRCAGTTGYDVLNHILGLFVDPAGEPALTTLYGQLTSAETDWHVVVDDAKHLVLTDVLGSEVARLVDLLRAICALVPEHRDHTRSALQAGLVELLAAFEVYRAYVAADGRPADETARRQLADAAAVARAKADPAVVDLVRDLALAEGLAGAEGEERRLRAEFTSRFQQTCGPVMAKGIEDTAFYRYGRLVALNEVGGDPGRFGTSRQQFLDFCTALQRDWPVSMTTLSTHDAKRSEDVRVRMALLSECPREWADAVTAWSAQNAHARPGGLPDRAKEYFLYQTFVGAWPLPVERAVAYAEKASREAKAWTSWTDPDPDYDAALEQFVRTVLADETFTRQVDAFVASLQPAWVPTLLAQKLVQLTAPGVADTYQGTDLVDLSLVDPDNRRPVDWDARRALLARLDGDGTPPGTDDPDAAKLWLVSRALRLRREQPEAFLADATFAPLTAAGSAADHVVAFSRSDRVVTVVPRLVLGLQRRGGWGDTTVELPAGRWTDRLTGASYDGGAQPLAELLGQFPVALLVAA
ncbi:MAG: malto-oligosyltrehalose synthase [Frankiales bacterium]|jgi:(1->4)-alpha-D-glucan 1-alpha-D-glucosylmutase|nr:malto-oligosyltrehalose synthase [Frankiales bacterium]